MRYESSVGDCSDIHMIVWLTTYILLHRSTLPTLHRMMTSSGRLVDPRVPRRWTPRFHLLPRSWPRTSHDRRRADYPTPAGLVSAATSAFSCGDPAAARHSLLFLLCRALHIT